jgi:hypothetical protein
MPSALIRITESGGSPSAHTTTVNVSQSWAVVVPLYLWNNPSWSIGTYWQGGGWIYNPFNQSADFSESHPYTGANYKRVMSLWGVPSNVYTIIFPFKKGMKGSGMYYLYGPKFFYGGLLWEVL